MSECSTLISRPAYGLKKGGFNYIFIFENVQPAIFHKPVVTVQPIMHIYLLVA